MRILEQCAIMCLFLIARPVAANYAVRPLEALLRDDRLTLVDATVRGFTKKGWQAEMQAGADAGSKGLTFEKKFQDGIMVFVRTKKGLMARADVSGTKYWKSELNE